jgi:hypothetical protein
MYERDCDDYGYQAPTSSIVHYNQESDERSQVSSQVLELDSNPVVQGLNPQRPMSALNGLSAMTLLSSYC